MYVNLKQNIKRGRKGGGGSAKMSVETGKRTYNP